MSEIPPNVPQLNNSTWSTIDKELQKAGSEKEKKYVILSRTNPLDTPHAVLATDSFIKALIFFIGSVFTNTTTYWLSGKDIHEVKKDLSEQQLKTGDIFDAHINQSYTLAPTEEERPTENPLISEAELNYDGAVEVTPPPLQTSEADSEKEPTLQLSDENAPHLGDDFEEVSFHDSTPESPRSEAYKKAQEQERIDRARLEKLGNDLEEL